MYADKRGLSDIVTTALIILLVAVAVAAIWSFVSPALRGTGTQFTKTQVCVSNIIEPIMCRSSASSYPVKIVMRRTASDHVSVIEEMTVFAAPSGKTFPSVHLAKNYPDKLPSWTGNIIKIEEEEASQLPERKLESLGSICDSGSDSSVCTISSQKVINGVVKFNKLVIADGGIITHDQKNSLSINAKEVIIEKGGSIDLNNKGFPGSEGPGAGKGGVSGCSGGGGGGHGGKGGDNEGGCEAEIGGGKAYDDLVSPSQPGSGGGYSGAGRTGPYTQGGAGGGAIILIAEKLLRVDGAIYANGGSEKPGGGGGAGGSVLIYAADFSGEGSIVANGGNGETGIPFRNTPGGGGGGGRIAFYYTTKTFSGTVSVLGGKGSNSGDKGTVYEEKTIIPLSEYSLPAFSEGNTLELFVGLPSLKMSDNTQAIVRTVYLTPNNDQIICYSLPLVCASS